VARQLCPRYAGRVDLLSFFLCCAVLFTFLFLFSFNKPAFRYASDAVILASCTALELLLLAKALRAVSGDFGAAYGIL
jgi:hypothetical protein